MVDDLISAAVEALADALGSSAADAAGSALADAGGSAVFEAVCNSAADAGSRLAVDAIGLTVEALIDDAGSPSKSASKGLTKKDASAADNEGSFPGSAND